MVERRVRYYTAAFLLVATGAARASAGLARSTVCQCLTAVCSLIICAI